MYIKINVNKITFVKRHLDIRKNILAITEVTVH